MKYNPNTREQIKELKDGRTIFKTHNGFRCWLEDQNGNTVEVVEEYYKKLSVHETDRSKKRK